MANSVIDIEGIGKTYSKILHDAEIRSTDDLLRHCATRSQRKSLARLTGLSEKLLLRWANCADLMRIQGVGEQFSELLEAAGVDTVKELKHRNPEHLAESMREVNQKGRRRLTRRTPSEQTVRTWIRAAKRLRPRLKY